MPYENRGDVFLTSKSQSPEQMRRVAESLGYDPGTVEEITDQPFEAQPDGTIPAAPQTEPPTPPSKPAVEVVQPPVEEIAADASETAAELETVNPPVQETPPPPAAPSRHKRQIQKRDAEIARVKADNDAKDRELVELRAKVGTPTPRAEVTARPAVEAPKPAPMEAEARPVYDEAKYPTYEDYIADVGSWGYREAQRKDGETKRIATESTAANAQRTLEAEAKQQLESNRLTEEQRWQASLVTARRSIPDFDAVMNVSRPTIAVPPLVVTAVRDRENAAQLSHWLISHPGDEAKVIGMATLPEKPTDTQVRLTYNALGRELDRITALLPAAEPDPDLDPEEEDEPEPAPVAAPRARPAAHPPAPVIPPKAPATPKPTPPPSVGQRTNTTTRSLASLSQRGDANEEALRATGGENYRKMRGL